MAEGGRGPLLDAADQYHAGLVADDPLETMSLLTEVSGYAWGEPMGGSVQVSLPAGDTVIELRTWYSTTTPRLEVVQAIPGTLWSRAGSGLHHFGYWVADVAATVASLEARGYVAEAVGRRPDGEPYWAFLIGPAGPRLEVVTRQLQPVMERYFATGTVA